MDKISRYRVACTLTFGDIYPQVIIWLITIFISLAVAMAMLGVSRPVYALATVGLILVLSLPFLLFAFVTTLLNHIELRPVAAGSEAQTSSDGLPAGQQPAQVAG